MSRWHLGNAVALVGVALGSMSACVYDSSDRCGEHMRYDAARRACVCEDDAVAVVGGCRPCAADEVVAGDACVCPEGEAKNDAGVCQ
jgi:hypothetical protein